jgi:tight adherence protein B
LTRMIIAAPGLIAFPVLGPVPAVLLTGAILVLRRCRLVQLADRRADVDRASLSAALRAVIDEHAAGAAVTACFAAAADSAGRFAPTFAAAGRAAGAGVDVALPFYRQATQRADLVGVGVACSTATRIGSALGPVLEGVRTDLDSEASASRAVSTLLAGPRTSALLLAALPAVGLGMGAAMGAHPVRILLHTGLGLVVLCIGVIFDIAGVVWTLVLTRRVRL